MCLHCALGVTDKCSCRCVSLKASASAAGALLSASCDYRVAKFCANGKVALDKLTVCYDTAANAGAESKHNNVTSVFSCAELYLCKGRNVCIVCDLDLKAGAVGNRFCDVEIVPLEVVGEDNNAVFAVDHTGNAHSYTDEVVLCKTCLFHKCVRKISDIGCDNLLAALGFGRNLIRQDNVAKVVNDTSLYKRSSKVYTYVILSDLGHNYRHPSFKLDISVVCGDKSCISKADILAIDRSLAINAGERLERCPVHIDIDAAVNVDLRYGEVFAKTEALTVFVGDAKRLCGVCVKIGNELCLFYVKLALLAVFVLAAVVVNTVSEV